MRLEKTTNSPEETRAFGKRIASFSFRGEVILLDGDLGAGKTTFTGGFASGLAIEEEVISPTFNIMKCYFKGRLPMYHIDAYRLEGQNIELGLEEFIEGDGVTLIEWPQYIAPLIPEDHLHIEIRHLGENSRRFLLSSDSPAFAPLFEALEATK